MFRLLICHQSFSRNVMILSWHVIHFPTYGKYTVLELIKAYPRSHENLDPVFKVEQNRFHFQTYNDNVISILRGSSGTIFPPWRRSVARHLFHSLKLHWQLNCGNLSWNYSYAMYFHHCSEAFSDWNLKQHLYSMWPFGLNTVFLQ